MVWNRTPGRCDPVRAAGAEVAASPDEVLRRARVSILMLADESAMDTVLGRGTPRFAGNVAGRVIVHMGTTSPGYSAGLEADVLAAGGADTWSPPSPGHASPPRRGGWWRCSPGGRRDGRGGTAAAAPDVRRGLRLRAGAGGALLMKLAVNVFLITTVTGLAEAVHFARGHGLDVHRLREVLDSGPMASDVSRTKAAKLAREDFTAQAAIADVLKNNRLIAEAARERGLASPLLDVCHALFGETLALGHGAQDMAAVIHALENRTATLHPDPT
ncbi:NAD(P)-dependent oxidoreductase [Nonomuraea ferruginea]